MGIEGEMVSKSSFVGQHYFSGAVVCHSSPSLEGHGLSNDHVSSSSSYSSTPSLHKFELGGLGGTYGQSHGLGIWSMTQREQHINVLEMKAVLLVLQALAVHIKSHWWVYDLDAS